MSEDLTIKIEDLPEELRDCIEDQCGKFLFEDEDWVEDGKYSYKSQIFKYDDKFYCRNLSRSGSYFTYWNFENDDYVTEMTRKEVVVKKIVWEPVKK